MTLQHIHGGQGMQLIWQHKKVHRIVSMLMEQLAIPDGHDLVPYFGDGHESNNREAITTWVRHMMPELDLDEVEPRLANLQRRAGRRMATACFEQRSTGT